jgi:hypothetical protein
MFSRLSSQCSDSATKICYGYERGDTWHIGLGSDTSLIDPKGEMATICTEDGKREDHAVNGRPLAKIAREFVAENSHSGDGGQIYGQVGFNYVAPIRRQA